MQDTEQTENTEKIKNWISIGIGQVQVKNANLCKPALNKITATYE